MMRSRALGVLTAGLLIAATCVACSSGSGSSGADKAIEVGDVGSFPNGLNPFVGTNGDSYTIWEYVYPELVQYDTSTLKLTGQFATSWSTSADGLVWTFHTKPNQMWSDGQPLTAADAAWTINTAVRFQNTAAVNEATYIYGISRASAPDADTLVIDLKAPVASLLPNLQSLPILPQHVWAQYATGKGTELQSPSNIPSGTSPFVAGGPFTVAKYVANDIVLLTRNPKWKGQRPRVGEFGIQKFSDASAAIQALESGEINYVERVPPDTLPTMASKGFAVVNDPALTFISLAVNAYHDPKHPELANPLVRQAFSEAIDRSTIASRAYLGYAQPVSSALMVPATGIADGTSRPWLDPSVQPAAYDLTAADQLLDRAGYPKGADGIRTAAGHAMSYDVILEESLGPAGLRLFTTMQADFAKIGIRLTVTQLGYGPALDAVYAKNYTQWDLLLDGNGGVIDPSFLLGQFTCAQLGSLNDNGYCDKGWDAAYAAQNAATSPSDRVTQVWNMEQSISRTNSYIGVVTEPQPVVMSKKLTGVIASPVKPITWLSDQALLGMGVGAG